MTFARARLTTFSAGMRRLFLAPEQDLLAEDAYEPIPLSREELTELFELNAAAAANSGDLVHSERKEHDKMSSIRAALYSEN